MVDFNVLFKIHKALCTHLLVKRVICISTHYSTACFLFSLATISLLTVVDIPGKQFFTLPISSNLTLFLRLKVESSFVGSFK